MSEPFIQAFTTSGGVKVNVHSSESVGSIDVLFQGGDWNIYSPVSGTVTRRETNHWSYGNYVGIQSEYGNLIIAHMRQGSCSLSLGDSVNRGGFVGVAGMTGQATGIHVHFQFPGRTWQYTCNVLGIPLEIVTLGGYAPNYSPCIFDPDSPPQLVPPGGRKKVWILFNFRRRFI